MVLIVRWFDGHLIDDRHKSKGKVLGFDRIKKWLVEYFQNLKGAFLNCIFEPRLGLLALEAVDFLDFLINHIPDEGLAGEGGDGVGGEEIPLDVDSVFGWGFLDGFIGFLSGLELLGLGLDGGWLGGGGWVGISGV